MRGGRVPVKIEDGPGPVNHYALTKAWAELMGEMYARVHRISVISARIGWLPRNPGEAAVLAAAEHGADLFFSHNDAARFFERCVESPAPQPGESAILFAVSRPARAQRLDPGPARDVIGYEPQDVWPQGLPYTI
jgi:nucleoside-diphosphate-sugar epimerase